VRHLPNLICIARIVLIWPIIYALSERNYIVALGIFLIAAISDGLDGYLAKRFGWQSQLGKFLDPAADKLLLVAVFVSATWFELVPQWLTAAAVARDFMIASGALVFRLWFGPLHGRPTILSKINTAVQLGYLASVMAYAAFGFPPEEMVSAIAIITFCTTVLSGIDYVSSFTRRAWAEPARS
jgi:cardiolipin synthase (CMP-forming)